MLACSNYVLIIFVRVSVTLTDVALLPEITSFKLITCHQKYCVSINSFYLFSWCCNRRPPYKSITWTKTQPLTVALVRYDVLAGIFTIAFITTESNLSCGSEFVFAVHVPLQNTLTALLFLCSIRCCHVLIAYVPIGLGKKKTPASDPVSARVRVPFVSVLRMIPFVLPPTIAGLVSNRIRVVALFAE